MSALCKTCGASMPGPHRPSVLDPEGIGDPGHKVTTPTTPENEELREKVAKSLYEAANFHCQSEDYPGIQKLTDRIMRLFASEIAKREEDLLQANEMLRSLYQVVRRRGSDTNWTALESRLKAELDREHETLKPYRARRIDDGTN